MARKVEDVKVLNIDETPYAVDTLSEAVQDMVAVFNGWNQKDADLTDELTMVRSAKNELSRRIILQVREDMAASEEGTGDGTDAAPAVEADAEDAAE